MIEYWAVLGRTCVDREFREKVLGLRVEGTDGEDFARLGGLREYLCEAKRYRLSRYEVADVNRVVLALEKHARIEVLERLNRLWDEIIGSDGAAYWTDLSEPRAVDLTGLIGLMAIDQEILNRYVTAAKDGRIGQEASRPPFLGLKDNEVTWLGRFFANSTFQSEWKAMPNVIWIVPDGQIEKMKSLVDKKQQDSQRDKKRKERLQAFVAEIESQAKTARAKCSGGFDFALDEEKNRSYVHLSPPLVDYVAGVMASLGK